MIGKIAFLAFLVAATPAVADNIELLPHKDPDLCGWGNSSPNSRGNYYYQKQCFTKAWLVNHDNNTIYSCYALNGLMQEKNGASVIDEKTESVAVCTPIHKFNIKVDSFATQTTTFVAAPCRYCGYVKNWDSGSAQGLWVADKNANSVEVCVSNSNNPDKDTLFSKCMTAVIQ